jgi:hypothetical protein
MSAADICVDLDDVAGLQEADRDGLLRACAMAGAQVRATATAVEEGALESITGGQRPRTVIWLAGRGPAEAAGAMLIAALGGTAGEPLVSAAEVPPWIGPLDTLVVAGDDPGDPILAAAAHTAVRRGARVVVVAPHLGPLRDATAGRAAVLEPRLQVPEEFGLCRYLAAGLATLAAVDPALMTVDLWALADELDAEAMRNSAGREIFTNPAKALAERMTGRQVVLAGDRPATCALARHGAAVLLRVGGQPVAAAGLADVLVALHGIGRIADPVDAMFHDEEIDGPRPVRPRVVALALAQERQSLTARLAGVGDVDIVGVEDVGEAGSVPAANGRPEQQLAVLAVRLEMAAVYLRLAGG